MGVNRRSFLRSAASISAAAIGCSLPATRSGPQPAGNALPSPQDSGIDHIIVLMMENRSFDHILGWMPAPRPSGRPHLSRQ